MEAVFFTTKRDGKIAVWVEVPGPDGVGIHRHNILDVPPKEFTERLMFAIVSAFRRGNEFSQTLLRRVDVHMGTNDGGWEERE